MATICRDNRFGIISKAREALLESTNIKESPEEMAVLDNFLFRCWQMGWLDKYETEYSKDYFEGMQHLADAVKYELDIKRHRLKNRARNCGDVGVYSECTNIAGGIEIATQILDKVLSMQLEVKGGETE